MMVLNTMLAGAIAMASLTIATIFFRFWRSTRDRFFLFFGFSFLLESLNRALLGLMASESEGKPLYYLLRLLAYVLIIIAVVDKNRHALSQRKRE